VHLLVSDLSPSLAYYGHVLGLRPLAVEHLRAVLGSHDERPLVELQTRAGVAPDRSLPGARVVRVLERLHVTMGLPRRIVMDNGPEFAGRALDLLSCGAL